MPMKETVIVGAGGHGRVVLDILVRRLKKPFWNIRGFLDDIQKGEITYLNKIYPILDVCSRVVNYDACIIAIGSNEHRASLFNFAVQNGVEIIKAIDRTAEISPTVDVGLGTTVCRCAIIQTNAKIGKNVIINTGAIIEHDNVIEDHAQIASGAHLGGEVHVCEGAFIGIGAIINRGLTIGAGSVIGAGAVVIKDVDANIQVREDKSWVKKKLS